MKKETIKELKKYWIATAEHDFETMEGLFRIKRYADCLFYGHIVLEKIIKSIVVDVVDGDAPKIHDLIKLGRLAKLDLLVEEWVLLKIVDRFNMRSRYPDIKLKFYKESTKEYTEEKLKQIKKLYQKIWAKAKQKK